MLSTIPGIPMGISMSVKNRRLSGIFVRSKNQEKATDMIKAIPTDPITYHVVLSSSRHVKEELNTLTKLAMVKVVDSKGSLFSVLRIVLKSNTAIGGIVNTATTNAVTAVIILRVGNITILIVSERQEPKTTAQLLVSSM